MKQLIPVISLFAALMVWVPSAHSSERTAPVVESLNQGVEDLVVSITTGTPMDVLAVVASTSAIRAAGTTENRAYRFVVVENLDATSNLFASPRANLTASGGNIGNIIKPGKWKLWILRPRQPFFVISAGSLAAGTSAYITAGR